MATSTRKSKKIERSSDFLASLTQEVFDLVERDQGRGFVPSSQASQHSDVNSFFGKVRTWEHHSRLAANKLRKFLKQHNQW